MNLDRLLSDIKDSRAGEGFRGVPYRDGRGCTTIAYGRNLDANPLTPDEGLYLLRNDLARVQADVTKRLPWVAALDDVRQRAVFELAFIVGVVGLLRFPKMLAALVAEEWVTARAEWLDSQMVKERQIQPARSDRLGSMLLTGEEL